VVVWIISTCEAAATACILRAGGTLQLLPKSPSEVTTAEYLPAFDLTHIAKGLTARPGVPAHKRTHSWSRASPMLDEDGIAVACSTGVAVTVGIADLLTRDLVCHPFRPAFRPACAHIVCFFSSISPADTRLRRTKLGARLRSARPMWRARCARSTLPGTIGRMGTACFQDRRAPGSPPSSTLS
jgi:hypothetical protein